MIYDKEQDDDKDIDTMRDFKMLFLDDFMHRMWLLWVKRHDTRVRE